MKYSWLSSLSRMRIRQRQQTAEEQSAIDELTTNYTIDAISAKCGFTSASTFYTLLPNVSA